MFGTEVQRCGELVGTVPDAFGDCGSVGREVVFEGIVELVA